MSTSPTTVPEFVATMTKEEMLAEILARLEEMNAQLHCLVEPSTSSRHPPTSTPIVDVGIEDREHEVTTLVAASSSRAATPSSAPPAPSSNTTVLQEATLAVDVATPKHPPATRTNCSTLGRNTGDPVLAAQDISLVVPVADPDNSTGVGYNSDNSFHGGSVLAASRMGTRALVLSNPGMVRLSCSTARLSTTLLGMMDGGCAEGGIPIEGADAGILRLGAAYSEKHGLYHDPVAFAARLRGPFLPFPNDFTPATVKLVTELLATSPTSLQVGCAAPRHKTAHHAMLSHDATRKADKILQASNDIRNGRGCREPKPPWLLGTEVFRSWSGKMHLISGFLLEVSPWCKDYMKWLQWQPSMTPPVQLQKASRGTNLQLLSYLFMVCTGAEAKQFKFLLVLMFGICYVELPIVHSNFQSYILVFEVLSGKPVALHFFCRNGGKFLLQPWPPPDPFLALGDQFNLCGNRLVVECGGLQPKPPWSLVFPEDDSTNYNPSKHVWLLLLDSGKIQTCLVSSIQVKMHSLVHEMIAMNMNLQLVWHFSETKQYLSPLTFESWVLETHSLEGMLLLLLCVNCKLSPRPLSQSKLLQLQLYASCVLGCAVSKCIVSLSHCVISWDYMEHWFELLAGAIQLDLCNIRGVVDLFQSNLYLIWLFSEMLAADKFMHFIGEFYLIPPLQSMEQMKFLDISPSQAEYIVISRQYLPCALIASSKDTLWVWALLLNFATPSKKVKQSLMVIQVLVLYAGCRCLNVCRNDCSATYMGSKSRMIALSKFWIQFPAVTGNKNHQNLLAEGTKCTLVFQIDVQLPRLQIIAKYQHGLLMSRVCNLSSSESGLDVVVMAWGQNLYQSQVWPAPYALGSTINLKLLAKCNQCKVQLWEPTILLYSFLRLGLWDPGGLLHNCQAMDLTLVIHVQERLGDKPCFKKGGMSGTLGWPIGKESGLGCPWPMEASNNTSMAALLAGRVVEEQTTKPAAASASLSRGERLLEASFG